MLADQTRDSAPWILVSRGNLGDPQTSGLLGKQGDNDVVENGNVVTLLPNVRAFDVSVGVPLPSGTICRGGANPALHSSFG